MILRKCSRKRESNRAQSGFYHLFEYQVAGEHIEPLEVLFRRDERIMRFLTVKLDKHAVEWAKTRVKRNKEKA